MRLDGIGVFVSDMKTMVEFYKNTLGIDVISKGAESVMEPTTEPWGQRTCYIADPEGNLIKIGSFNE